MSWRSDRTRTGVLGPHRSGDVLTISYYFFHGAVWAVAYNCPAGDLAWVRVILSPEFKLQRKMKWGVPMLSQ
jgi:hypothetical protein